MKRRSLLLFVCLFGVFGQMAAQNVDFGGILSLKATKKLSDFAVSTEVEGRMDHNFTNFDHLRVGLGGDYTFFKDRFKVGIIEYYRLKNQHEYWENEYRTTLHFNYTETIRQFKISYRARFQFEFYDNGRHALNPEICMRNRVEGRYVFPNNPVELALSEEFFWQLNAPTHYIIDKLRTVLSVDYKFNKKHLMTFYVRYDMGVQVEDPIYDLYLGVTYHFKH